MDGDLEFCQSCKLARRSDAIFGPTAVRHRVVKVTETAARIPLMAVLQKNQTHYSGTKELKTAPYILLFTSSSIISVLPYVMLNLPVLCAVRT
jgi:hypothetical protein